MRDATVFVLLAMTILTACSGTDAELDRSQGKLATNTRTALLKPSAAPAAEVPAELQIDEATLYGTAMALLDEVPERWATGLSRPGVLTVRVPYGSGITAEDINTARQKLAEPLLDPPLLIEIQVVHLSDLSFELDSG